ncbi:hypothetical protein LCGC14_2981840 [marine sediment metagenome]|uniref:Uncharacterized protein n=1 Tax=marine sediment metagenome TaxID=412755 RepID=A0A0F8X6B5_9ZZZZ
MAFTGIYVPTLVEFQYKCGEGVSIVASSEAYANSFIEQAESVINMVCRRVFAVDSSAFTALPSTTKGILTQVASDLAAIYAVLYDMSGYSSRIEAEDVVNILRDSAQRGLSLLRDTKQQDFLPKGTL